LENIQYSTSKSNVEQKIRNKESVTIYGMISKLSPCGRIRRELQFRDNGCRPQWFLIIDILCKEESFPEFSGK